MYLGVFLACKTRNNLQVKRLEKKKILQHEELDRVNLALTVLQFRPKPIRMNCFAFIYLPIY